MNYKIHPLSEKAITLYFEQKIDPKINDLVVATTEWIMKNPFSGLIEVVPSYAAVTVFYDLVEVKLQTTNNQMVYEFVKEYLQNIPFNKLEKQDLEKKVIEIPVEYNGSDLAVVSSHTGLKEREIVRLHTAQEYRVFMMGFLPGFAYLGGMDNRLSTPRRENPRLRVKAGSVGIAGNQTGVYPLDSPGGWQIIGKTDLTLFDPNREEMCLLAIGNYVRFKAL